MKEIIIAEFQTKEKEHAKIFHKLKGIKTHGHDLSNDHFCQSICEVIKDIEHHNEAEEILMRDLCYDDIYPHAISHNDMTAKMKTWYKEYLNSNIKKEDLIDMTTALVASHIKDFDTDIDWFALLKRKEEIGLIEPSPLGKTRDMAG